MDGGEDASAKVDAAEIGSILGAPIDPDFTDIMPGDLGVEDAIYYGVTDGDFGIPVEDSSEFIRFNLLFTTDDPGAIDETDGEKLLVEDELSFEDTPPIDGWDPSWLYRTLTSVASDGSEEIIIDQGTGWEDGLGFGVASDGFVPGDLTPNNLDGDGVPDDFVKSAVDPLPLDEVSGEPVDVVEDGELLPIRTLEPSDFDPAVIFYLAAGGVELQRTNDNGSVQEETASASIVAIPVRPSSSNSLFNYESGRSSVGIPVGVQSTSALGSSSSPTKRNATQRRSSTQVTATRQPSESEGLNNLTPLLGGEASQGHNDSRENVVDPHAVESGSIEETVGDSGSASSVASGFAASQNVPLRSGRSAMIDRVMAQYAEKSFNS